MDAFDHRPLEDIPCEMLYEIIHTDPYYNIPGLRSLNHAMRDKVDDLVRGISKNGGILTNKDACHMSKRFGKQLTKLSLRRLQFAVGASNWLSRFTGLTNLTISRCNGDDFAPATSTLSGLTSLDLSGSDLHTTTAHHLFTALTNLRVLNLADCNDVAQYVSCITSLEELDMSRLVGWMSIRDLAPLTRLRRLALVGVFVTQVQELSALTNLTELDLTRAHSYPRVHTVPLAGLTLLKKLSMPVCDVASLPALTSLTELDLTGCSTLQDVWMLPRLVSLEILRMPWRTAEEPQALALLPRLKHLTLVSDVQHDAAQLSALTCLEVLDLTGCRVRNTAALNHLNAMVIYDGAV